MAVLTVERVERPALLFGADPDALSGAARASDEDMGGGLTLDDAIVGAWEGLAAQVAVACPLCSGRLLPEAAATDGRGRCEDCGTTLT